MSRFSETNIYSARQEILLLLWNTCVQYIVHKGSPVGPILSHMNLINNVTAHFFKIYFKIIFTSASLSPKISPIQFCKMYATRQVHRAWTDRPNSIFVKNKTMGAGIAQSV
jgi:hypothetical protein